MVLSDSLSVGKAPDVSIETAIFSLDDHKGFGIVDGRLNLELVSYDSRILSQGFLLVLIILGDDAIVETIKGLTKSLSLIENAFP